jgi:quercetin 2,3-dioxygenase
MLDYAAPHEFTPSTKRRGVDTHPHRGFETVTSVYAGEVEHRDSGGNSGRIGPGGMQWMTAAPGVVHEELPIAGYGPFVMNTPAQIQQAIDFESGRMGAQA